MQTSKNILSPLTKMGFEMWNRSVTCMRHRCVVGCQQLKLGLLLGLSTRVGWTCAPQNG